MWGKSLCELRCVDLLEALQHLFVPLLGSRERVHGGAIQALRLGVLALLLIEHRADVHATHARGVGGLQQAAGSSGWATAALERAGCQMTYGEPKRQRTSTNQSRQSRLAISNADPDSCLGRSHSDKGQGQ